MRLTPALAPIFLAGCLHAKDSIEPEVQPPSSAVEVQLFPQGKLYPNQIVELNQAVADGLAETNTSVLKACIENQGSLTAENFRRCYDTCTRNAFKPEVGDCSEFLVEDGTYRMPEIKIAISLALNPDQPISPATADFLAAYYDGTYDYHQKAEDLPEAVRATMEAACVQGFQEAGVHTPDRVPQELAGCYSLLSNYGFPTQGAPKPTEEATTQDLLLKINPQ